MISLLSLAATAVTAVSAPTAALAITCDTATNNGSTWYDGPSAGYTYDRTFSSSFAVPKLSTNIPQGAATWRNWDGEGTDLILVTSYHDGANTYILAIDARTGQHVGSVPIAPFHAGGITVVSGWILVGTGITIRRYPISSIRAALQAGGGTTAVPAAGSQTVAAASFLGTYAGAVFSGKFHETARGYLDQYTVNGDGTLTQVPGGHWEAPTKTQGVVVTATHFLFSTSYGRANRSNIYSVRRGYTGSLDTATLKCFRAPSMSEGMTEYGGNAYVVYESGSYCCASDPSTRNVIRNLHKATLSSLAAMA